MPRYDKGQQIVAQFGCVHFAFGFWINAGQ